MLFRSCHPQRHDPSPAASVLPHSPAGQALWRHKPFHKVTVTFGKPITFEEYYGKKPDNETLQTLADEVMQTIYSFDNTDIKKIGEQK